MSKTWFITGASRGFGRNWTEAALQRGDKVAATARDINTLKDLADSFGDAILPIALDVTDRAAAAVAAVGQAHAHFGRLDVVVNNAGYGHFGFLEEISETEARAQLETNMFGALWVTQAAIPLMRARGSGHIVQISSIGGVAAFPGLGIYHASKWALEGFSDALSQEVAPFGIKVTLIEPGGYATDWAGSSAVLSEPNPAYQPMRDARTQGRARYPAPGRRPPPPLCSPSWTPKTHRCACCCPALPTTSPRVCTSSGCTRGRSGKPRPGPPSRQISRMNTFIEPVGPGKGGPHVGDRVDRARRCRDS